jgi:asparagine N-glycosylation enzyme membrane subunit Stt3
MKTIILTVIDVLAILCWIYALKEQIKKVKKERTVSTVMPLILIVVLILGGVILIASNFV